MYFFIFIIFLIEIPAASDDQGLHCLPISQNRNAMLHVIWVKMTIICDLDTMPELYT